MISLAKDTISHEDIDKLVEWLKTYPRLTMGELTEQFEKEWSKWLGVKYSVFVNSGSSANLMMVHSLILSKRLKNKKIIVPAVSWSTTVMPVSELGLVPILCDSDENNLGISPEHFEELCQKYHPSAVILVSVLGVSCSVKKIMEICQKYDVIVLEDCCEAMGSVYNNFKLGTFGLMSTFSFYFGHAASTIEGGVVSTNNEEIYHLLLMSRAHGWNRSLPEQKRERLRKEWNIVDFQDLYTFYEFAYNFRSTDLNAFIGIQQLKSLDDMLSVRARNFEHYQREIRNKVWKIRPDKENEFIPSLAYPVISDKIATLVKRLREKEVEIRPLVCGSIGKQPFWIKKYGEMWLRWADTVHWRGCYVPNHHLLTTQEVQFVCDTINEVLDG